VYEARELLKSSLLEIDSLADRKDIDRFILREKLVQVKERISITLDTAEEVREEYIKSAENIEKRFGETPISIYCKEMVDKIDKWLEFIRLMGTEWDYWLSLHTAHEIDAVVAHKTKELIGYCLFKIWEFEL
jgi:hypothetical protein